MSVFERDGVRIHYEEHGEGYPVLLIAPGGMRSRIAAWKNAPWNPITALRHRFRLVAMDQRNAGSSIAPVTGADGWATYTRDQLALLDHLGIDQFAIVGMCIGGPYTMGLVAEALDRISAAVMLQPIGLEKNRDAFDELFKSWAVEIRDDHPEADQSTWDAFRENMFGGSFMFNASREDVAACNTPLLVLMGDDLFHPQSISRAVAELAPNASIIESWKKGDDLAAADRAIAAFLESHC